MTAEKQDSTAKMMQKMTVQEVQERASIIYDKDCLSEVRDAINNGLFGFHANPRIEFERSVNGDAPAYYANFYGGM